MPRILARPSRMASVVVLALAAGTASAQVYRIVGPDGRVTFSDQPPQDAGSRANAAAGGAAATSPGGGAGALPYELRQVVQRYPVIFYTGPDCPPCAVGRNYLSARGIPYTEKTVTTAQDAAALQRLTGGASLPTLSVGSQVLNGFSEVEWAQYLNAAGYPASSQLPTGWRAPAPTPLTAAAPAAAPKPAPAAPAPAPFPTAPLPATPANNPAGITF